MANIKSAKKRINVSETKRVQNQSVKSEIKTYMKKFNTAIETKEKELASELFKKCSGLLDAAATDNVIHQNKANRHKSKMAQQLGQLTA
ncbi:MAG: 30S ribosomal protein S20 [Firmicutes bacterium]|nr:30S ribosomal protein S20 [Bacillota bacterium]